MFDGVAGMDAPVTGTPQAKGALPLVQLLKRPMRDGAAGNLVSVSGSLACASVVVVTIEP